jgi:uncharacterized protein
VVLLAVVLLSFNFRPQFDARREKIWSAIVGTLSGIMGGVSTLTGPLIITYLMSLKLEREVFVGTVSVIYLVGAVTVYGAIASLGGIGKTELGLSALALVPMSVGLMVGQRLRGRLSEKMFRQVMMGFLVIVALGLIIRAVF